MLWMKTLHLLFVVGWFSGLFYLPRIFVNLATAHEPAVRACLLRMAQKLFYFMSLLALIALVFGACLWLGYGIGRGQTWMHAKLACVGLVLSYQGSCFYILRQFLTGQARRSALWYRWFNELPVLLLFLVLLLVVFKDEAVEMAWAFLP
jgi:protoporphyrinogen IX oxidase